MALFAFAAFYIADFPLFKTELRLSPLIIGVVLGMVYANTLRNHLPAEWVPGIKFTGKVILRLSIILYGFRLTFADVIAVGWGGVLTDVIMVSSVLLLGMALAKLMHMDRDTALLTCTGSAICGAAAVLGAEPVLGGKPNKTVVAVSTVVIFGTVSMFLYPMLYRWGLLSAFTPNQVGVYTGATLHEVAHVAGAGATMGDAVIANTATITKMMRVILLAPYLLLLAWFVKGKPVSGSETGNRAKPVQIPWFAVWFLVVIGINTLLGYGAQNVGWHQEYAQSVKIIEWFDNFGLTMAMVALGTDASFAKFREAGVKPFLLAAVLFLWLVLGGYFVTLWVA